MKGVIKLSKSGGALESRHSLLEFVRQERFTSAVDLLEIEPEAAQEIDKQTGETALHLAARNGLANFVELILTEGDLDLAARDLNGDDVLSAAMASGNQRIVDMIFKSVEESVPHLVNNHPQPS